MCFYCNCEVLTKNKRGEVLRNGERTFISVQFGNIDFTLKELDFISFYTFISSLSQEHLKEMTNHWNHKIVIRQKTFMGGYCFYPDEYNEFKQLIGEAVGIIQLEKEIKNILEPKNLN